MPHATSPSPEAEATMNVEDSHMTDAPALPLEAEPSSDLAESQELPANGGTANLDSIFDDDDDDDEYSSSAPRKPEDSLQDIPQQVSKPKYSSPDILRQFYQRLFPFRPLFQWLNHSPTPQPDFQNREFAFVLPGGAYIRYQSFASADLFRKHVNPRDRKQLRKASAFRPVMKELVFDIDMTDYDPIRTCCSGAAICNKCWQFITMAVKVVDTALREDFGFQHILWVYSGRRGAHAWISDKRAREMDDTKRRSLANYLVLAMGNEQGKRGGIRRPLHPHIDRSLKILNPYFQTDVLADQDPWASTEQADKILQLLPDKGLTTALQKKWDSMPGRTSNQRWADIDAVAEAGHLSTMTAKQLVEAKQDIRLEYTYPRLDAEVSKKLNHLLKSPFVVHPGTGRVCVPIDTRDLEAFDPLSVPTVTELLREIDEWDNEHKDSMSADEKAKVQDWQKTRLKGYVEFFRGYVAGLLKEENKGKRGREEDVAAGADSMEF
ncbi:p48 polypeptide of DNA primase [Recurvomyces mirabilis]|uniref:DNA primase n=1 Tax=Recurvomyces mirabilis TaxID=574656 RepID=A0AAE0WI43_9PEZI|nr:p48 polypeptide of DNA primase [Recurvomyces mirabilis]KAK5149672.1 p48 polypeptide of DNA primase [Recurvomyces mirabilis]